MQMLAESPSASGKEELIADLEQHGFVDRSDKGKPWQFAAFHALPGRCPGLLYGGSHGEDEVAVFEQLCAAVNEAIDLYRRDGKALPPTRGRDYASKMLSVVEASLTFA